AADNAPTILTAIGVTGAITTAILAGKASFKASEIINREQARHDLETQSHPFTPKEKFLLVWPQYVPAAATAAMTVAAIVCSNRISTKRAAALASAYTVSQEVLERYKDKVAKVLGEEKAKEVSAEVKKEMIRSAPPKVILSGQQHQVHELYTDTWFTSTYEALKQAEIDINFQIIHDGYASLSDFFRMVDATHGAVAEEIGWNTDRKMELDIDSEVIDGTPVFTLDFRTVPVRGYGSNY
ncbi:MAG TPA: DUF6353 family protein, partial [Actinomycetota bacterium]|nr:DUF6353 family protein [Actinomycetota bacterium]